MIGIEAHELRVGDKILGGVGTVIALPSKPDAWGDITVKVKEDDGSLFLIKLDAEFWLRIEREGASVE